MSDDPKDAFSIEFDDEGGNVPGVTQLLNPKAMAEKAAAKKAAADATGKPPPILKKSMPTSLEVTQAHELKSISIGFDDESGGTVPGVSQLLNPKAMAAKAQAAKIPNQFSASSSQTKTTINPLVFDHEIELHLEEEAFPPSATASHQPPAAQPALRDAVDEPERTRMIVSQSKLAKLGVQLELVFEKKKNQFRFTRVKGHSKTAFEPWQEKFFSQMKVDLAALGIQISFQEFSKKQHLFQAEAFGMTDFAFVQIVRLENDSDRIFVLLSETSLLMKQDEVRAELSGKTIENSDDTGEFKIELAS